MLCEWRKFYDPESVIQQVEDRLKSTVENVEYVTFVPDGEPTRAGFLFTTNPFALCVREVYGEF
jgi:hypothetical protein